MNVLYDKVVGQKIWRKSKVKFVSKLVIKEDERSILRAGAKEDEI